MHMVQKKKAGIQSKNQPPHKHASPISRDNTVAGFSMSFQRFPCRGHCSGGQEAPPLARDNGRASLLNATDGLIIAHSEWPRRDTWSHYPVTVRKKGLTSTLPTSKPFLADNF